MHPAKILPPLLGLLALLPWNETRAGVSLDFGGAHALTIQPGDSLAFDIFLVSTAEQTTGLTYFFTVDTVGDAANPGSGKFTLTARDTTGSTYSDLITSNSTLLLPENAVLAPRNAKDAGALLENVGQPNGAGTFFVASYTMQTDALLPSGVYQLTLSDAIYSDQDFNARAFDSLGTYTVTVVPEPASAALVLLGICALAVAIRRQKSRRGPLARQ